jgi:hypothetical protein
LQGIDGNFISVEARKYDALIVAVGACGCRVIPIEAVGATRGMVVGRRRGNIGIAAIRGAVVQTSPAGDEG